MAKDLTKGKISTSLFELGWPMTIGLFAVMGFNIVDTYFVGQLGTKELAAMSLTFPVVMIVASLSFGIGIALTSMVSREIGAKNFENVKFITTDGLTFSLIAVSLITVIGLLTMDPIFKFMGARGDILKLVKEYMEIWYINVFFLIVPMVANGAIRATGNTKFPALIMVLAGVVNFIFDPLLIFGIGPFPRLELQGAAIATVISRVCTFIAALYVLHHHEKMLVNPFRSFQQTIKNWKNLLQLSIPVSLGNAIVPFSMFIITSLVSGYGELVIAGFGVGTRIEAIFTILLIGVSAGLGPFVGQNYGAKQFHRVHKALAGSNRFDLFWILFSGLVVFIFGDYLVSLFSTNKNVQEVAGQYLRILVFSLFLVGVLLNTNSALNAIGNPKLSLALTFTRMIVIYIPMAIFLESHFSAKGIFYAGAVANIVAGIIAHLVFTNKYKECSKKLFITKEFEL